MSCKSDKKTPKCPKTSKCAKTCNAYLKVVNAIIPKIFGQEQLIFDNGIKILEPLTYLTGTPSIKLFPGRHRFSLKNQGDSDTKAYVDAELIEERSYTLVLTGDESSTFPIEMKLVPDVSPPTNNCMASIRFINLSPNPGLVDLLADNTLVFLRTKYGEYGGPNMFIQFRAGQSHKSYLLQSPEIDLNPLPVPQNMDPRKMTYPNVQRPPIPPPSSSPKVLQGPSMLNVDEGRIYSLYVVGRMNDPQYPIALWLIQDFPIIHQLFAKKLVLTPILHRIDETQPTYARLRVTHGLKDPLTFMQGDNRLWRKVSPMTLTEYAVFDPSKDAPIFTARIPHGKHLHKSHLHDPVLFSDSLSSLLEKGKSYTLVFYPEGREPATQLFDDSDSPPGHTRFLNMTSSNKDLKVLAWHGSSNVSTRQGEWVHIPSSKAILDFSRMDPLSRSEEPFNEPHHYNTPILPKTHTVLVTDSDVRAF